jgi:hypothetical protein
MRDLTHEARVRTAQVADALATLKPTTRKRTAAKEEIEDALNLINRVATANKDLLRPRQSRRALQKLSKALKRCEALARPLAKQHSEWAKRPLDLSEHIERCEEELRYRTRPRARRTAPRQQLAAFMARKLIAKYRPNDKKAAALTRRGTWHQLSAILAGDRRLDSFNHMRAINRSWVPIEALFTATLVAPV